MRPPILASYLLLGLFVLFSVLTWNAEFMLYAAVLVPLVILLHAGDGRFSFRTGALWAFDAWLLLHLLGGMASWQGTRFYDLILFPLVGEPYSILKYDQAVHLFCFLVFALLVGSVVAEAAKRQRSPWLLGGIIMFATMGVGALNEVIEFLPVVLFDASGPGGYVNTALDLVANTLGAAVGSWLFVRRR